MATNLSVEAPDFPKIVAEAGPVTSDAVKLLWQTLNYEIKQRRTNHNRAVDYLEGTIIPDITTAGANNLDIQKALVYYYNTASSFAITGFRNGVEGRVVFLHNIGAGTITFTHDSGSSDAANRFLNVASANVTMATNESMIYLYVNSRWREVELAA